MLALGAVSGFVLAIHILAAIAGFGAVFTFPLLLAFAGRTDPTITPWLLRARAWLSRYLVHPGLVVVLLAGIYLASDEHQWSDFYVGWGVLAVIVIGGLEGSLITRRAGRMAATAERDLAATAVPGGGQRTSATWSEEYLADLRVLTRASWGLIATVVVTVFLMATHAGA